MGKTVCPTGMGGKLKKNLELYRISTDVDSEIRSFADDCVCYREIKDTEDTLKHQKPKAQLGCLKETDLSIYTASPTLLNLMRRAA